MARTAFTAGVTAHQLCQTGHILKDPDSIVKYHTGTLPGIEAKRANHLLKCAANLDAVLGLLDGL